jgi:hypothetical protein
MSSILLSTGLYFLHIYLTLCYILICLFNDAYHVRGCKAQTKTMTQWRTQEFCSGVGSKKLS